LPGTPRDGGSNRRKRGSAFPSDAGSPPSLRQQSSANGGLGDGSLDATIDARAIEMDARLDELGNSLVALSTAVARLRAKQTSS
jgi:hypothetical protein